MSSNSIDVKTTCDVYRNINKLVIQTPYVTLFDNALERLMDRVGSTPLPGGIRVIADAGSGKTFLAKRAIKRFPPNLDNGKQELPVALITLDTRTTQKQIAVTVLKALNYPFTGRRTTDDLTLIIVKAIRYLKIKILIFDEFQHVLSGNRKITSKDTSDWIKRLMDKTGIGIIILGTDPVKQLPSVNGQLASRISTEIQFAPAVLNKYFVCVLKAYEEAIGIDIKYSLAEPENASAIFTSTSGSIRHIRFLLTEAAIEAVQTNNHVLTEKCMSTAHRLVFGNKANPFHG